MGKSRYAYIDSDFFYILSHFETFVMQLEMWIKSYVPKHDVQAKHMLQAYIPFEIHVHFVRSHFGHIRRKTLFHELSGGGNCTKGN